MSSIWVSHTHSNCARMDGDCRPRARGYVAEDNSGKANIFGVEVRMTALFR